MNPNTPCPTSQGNSNQNNLNGDNTQSTGEQIQNNKQGSNIRQEIGHIYYISDSKGLDYTYKLLKSANNQIDGKNAYIGKLERELDKRDFVLFGVTIIYFLTMF